MRRGQAWSLDVTVAIILFLVLLVAVVFLSISLSSRASVKEFKTKGEIIFKFFSEDDEFRILDEKQIDIDQLYSAIGDNYSDIKSKVGIPEDFCVYFVDNDGNLVYMDEARTIPGIGSGRIQINGVNCT